MGGLCDYLIKQDIGINCVPNCDPITIDELNIIIHDLLAEVYELTEKGTNQILNNKITQLKDLGLIESEEKQKMLSGCQSVALSNRYILCKIIRNCNIRIFEVFADIGKKDIFLDSLTKEVSDYYYNDIEYEIRLFNVKITERYNFIHKKLFGDFVEAFANYRVIEILNKQGYGKSTNKFIDYLHHDNKIALMEKIRELIVGKKGREVAKVIMALEDKGYLTIPTKGLEDLRKSMVEEFGNIGTQQSISNYYQKYDAKGISIIPQSEINKIIHVLP